MLGSGKQNATKQKINILAKGSFRVQYRIIKELKGIAFLEVDN